MFDQFGGGGGGGTGKDRGGEQKKHCRRKILNTLTTKVYELLFLLSNERRVDSKKKTEKEKEGRKEARQEGTITAVI